MRHKKRDNMGWGLPASAGGARDNATNEQFFDLGTKLAETLVAKLTNSRFADSVDYKRAMLFFFCKAYKTYQAVELLWRNGFVEDATSLARSIYEIRVQVIFINLDPLSRSKQFVYHWLTCSIGISQILRRLHPDLEK
jgi:hypothetical protein